MPNGCLRHHSRCHVPGTSTRPLISQTATGPFLAPSMISRRLPASSSFVLAAARLRALQLDPCRPTRRPGQLRGRSRRTVRPARQCTLATGPGSYALLTRMALMGAAMRNACHRLARADLADLRGVSRTGRADSEQYESCVRVPCPSVTLRRGHPLSGWPVRRGATAAAPAKLLLTIMSLRAGQRSRDRPHDRTAAAHVGRGVG